MKSSRRFVSVRLAKATVTCFRGDGSLMDLAKPLPAEIDVSAMAGNLSRISRFSGCTAYSVAQHSVLGADAILREGGDELTAALFLLHDAHEYLLGDMTSPVLDLLASVTGDVAGARAASALLKAYRSIKAGWDEAIYAALKLPPPSAWTNSQRNLVKDMDMRMLAAESRELLGPDTADLYPEADHPRPAIRGLIRPWGAMKAEECFRATLLQLIGHQRVAEAEIAHHMHRSLEGRPA